EFGIYFAEQPVAPLDVAWMADVRANVQVPVMADESVSSPQDAMALICAGAADVFSVYVGKGGGIGPARKVAAIAEGAGLTCTVYADVHPGRYRVTLVKPGFGSKSVELAIEPGAPPYQFRLLSDSLVGYMWPKWARTGESSEFRVHAVEAYRLSLWRYGFEKE